MVAVRRVGRGARRRSDESGRDGGGVPAAAARAVYDAHGRAAYTLAFGILSDRDAAERAVEEAFRTLRFDLLPGDQPRMLLLHVYDAATTIRDRQAPVAIPVDPAGPLDSLPSLERDALLLCQRGLTCSDVAAILRVPKETVIEFVHSALVHVQADRARPQRTLRTSRRGACGDGDVAEVLRVVSPRTPRSPRPSSSGLGLGEG